MSAHKHILLVDDDDDLRGALAEQLRMTDEFDTTEASWGTDGVTQAKEGDFDLV